MERTSEQPGSVAAHMRRKRWLQIHAGAYAIVNGFNVGIWLLQRTGPPDPRAAEAADSFWPGWLMLLLAVPLGAHGLYVFARKWTRTEPAIPPPSGRGPRSGRGVMTVLFTDIVGSTERAAREGDRRWRSLLDRHDAVANAIVSHGGGRFVKSTGDGILAVFEVPNRAIAAAVRLRDELRAIGLDVRVGLHVGEVELRGRDVGGIGVHIAARVMAASGPGEITVSRTVRDLVTGVDVAFEDRGVHDLKGVGEWHLYAVAGPA